jgi:uncharacterized membrane protein YbjE (DUF340 family)
MRAYDPAAWGPFFTAMIATAAGLTGLLFVAVSINLDKMLALHSGGGFYWLAPAALLGTVGAVYNAWVLLVEIVR